jgi:hypothetical protein
LPKVVDLSPTEVLAPALGGLDHGQPLLFHFVVVRIGFTLFFGRRIDER